MAAVFLSGGSLPVHQDSSPHILRPDVTRSCQGTQPHSSQRSGRCPLTLFSLPDFYPESQVFPDDSGICITSALNPNPGALVLCKLEKMFNNKWLYKVTGKRLPDSGMVFLCKTDCIYRDERGDVVLFFQRTLPGRDLA